MVHVEGHALQSSQKGEAMSFGLQSSHAFLLCLLTVLADLHEAIRQTLLHVQYSLMRVQ